MNDFLKDIIKETGNEYASLVADGVEAGDNDTFIDTGSYIFNALLSGSIHGGLPSNTTSFSLGEHAFPEPDLHGVGNIVFIWFCIHFRTGVFRIILSKSQGSRRSRLQEV